MHSFARSTAADAVAAAAILLSGVAAAAGLLVPDLYRDAEAWVRQARASDLTTLLVAVPLLGLGLWRARRGSAVGQLVTWGVLGFLVYGYAIFAFAVATNAMTLLHYAVLGLATWSLLISAVAVLRDGRLPEVGSRLPRRTASWFLIVTASLFGLLWLGEIVGSILSGSTAPAVAALGLTANPVWALDLAFALPLFGVAGVMLLRRHPVGAVLALPALVFVVVMGLSILAIFAFDAVAGVAIELPPVVLVGGVVVLAALLTARGMLPARWPAAARRLGPLASTAVGLEVVLALGAIAGGLALMIGPGGEILPLRPEWLAGSPFRDYLVPGLVLFGVLGIGPLLVAALAIRRDRIAPLLTVMVGLSLLVWLAVQIAIIGFTFRPPLQPIYVVLGLVIVLVGLAWWRAAAVRGAHAA